MSYSNHRQQKAYDIVDIDQSKLTLGSNNISGQYVAATQIWKLEKIGNRFSQPIRLTKVFNTRIQCTSVLF